MAGVHRVLLHTRMGIRVVNFRIPHTVPRDSAIVMRISEMRSLQSLFSFFNKSSSVLPEDAALRGWRRFYVAKHRSAAVDRAATVRLRFSAAGDRCPRAYLHLRSLSCSPPPARVWSARSSPSPARRPAHEKTLRESWAARASVAFAGRTAPQFCASSDVRGADHAAETPTNNP